MAATLIVGLLAWLRPKATRSSASTIVLQVTFVNLTLKAEIPKIHSVDGIPTLQHLTEGIELNRRQRAVADRLYGIGLEQFKHFVNNRDGVIEESRIEMAKLSQSVSQSDIALAEKVGIELATAKDDEQRRLAEEQYECLTAQAKVYAHYKQNETDAKQRNARDIETNTPRTDYTKVKSLIASGSETLDSILTSLPICWQEIRSINQRADRPKITGKPPEREFLHVEFMTRERGLLEDERAERDGAWIVSNKHRMEVPYQDPVPIYEFRRFSEPPVRTGERVIVNQDPTSEWDTEFWRQGGRLDQVYLRARDGMSPEQLWKTYRRRQINRLGWILGSLVCVADIIILLLKYG